MEEKINAWIARNKYGFIAMFENKPKKMRSECWYAKGYFFGLEDSAFPQVKWEDEEPTGIELTIKIKD